MTILPDSSPPTCFFLVGKHQPRIDLEFCCLQVMWLKELRGLKREAKLGLLEEEPSWAGTLGDSKFESHHKLE